MKGAALNRFLLERGGVHWDEFLVPNVKVGDLSEAAFNRFRKEASESGRVDKEVLEDSNEVLIENLHLIDETGQLKRSATAMRLLQKLDNILEPVGHGAGSYYRIRNY